ncbi:MAG: NAD(P)/FAD-dependent oxidoreductase [Anaerolineaceae bacterium]|nr:NAD(P)/FAD-dependent oxidoreductase [Anaerolineaceae bacterium]
MNNTSKQFDVVIIGGGITGSMAARELSRYQLKIALIDKNADIGAETTAANSAIIHAGYDPVPGSLKAQMNVLGNPLWDELSEQLDFAYSRRGDYVVAVGDEELENLEKLHQIGIQNGVPGMQIITADEMRRREPLINPRVSAALWAKTGGVCDPFGANIAAAENAVMNGVQVYRDTKFTGFLMEGTRITGISTNQGDFKCRWVINAAGVYADEVMHAAGVHPEFKITARRGEYFILDRAGCSMDQVLFPVPTDAGKGIVVTASVHGNVIVGPNANLIDDKEDKAITRPGMDEIWSGAQKLVPSIKKSDIIALFSGMRAHGNAPTPGGVVDYQHDFMIEIAPGVEGLINLAGIESPGLTAAPAIALRVVELLKDAGEKLLENPAFNPIRKNRPRFRHLSHAQQKTLIEENPLYGRVVCRCEMVTEGEIVAEIHSPIPATTYDGIKRRTWLGTGRCLGGFDMPKVVDILARELGVSPFEITKKGAGSEYLTCYTKDGVCHDKTE